MKTIKVLFVCTGNICRSPVAHGIFRDLVNKNNLNDMFEIDSAGTSSNGWHEGDPSDPRSINSAKDFNCDISDLRSRQLTTEDFVNYDHIVIMDDKNLRDIKNFASDIIIAKKVTKLLSYAPNIKATNVPDPYLNNAFESVYLMIDSAINLFFSKIKKDYRL